MSAPATIDYDSLAKQSGAIAAPAVSVDYDALASQHGGAPVATKPAEPQATIGAQPGGVQGWLKNLEGDVKYGGTATLFGKILHHIGAQGTEFGAGKDSGGYLASPVLGPIHAAQGVAATPEHPIAGPVKALGGVLETATLPAAFIAPGAAEVGAEATAQVGSKAAQIAKAIPEMIPSAERAGKLFQEVKAAAGAKPIDVSLPGNTALEIDRLAQSGGSMPKVVRDFLKRASDPDKGAITYSEARDFYSNASRLSADEAQRLTPNMKRMVGQFTFNLGKSIKGAAAEAGQAENYQQAMSEYAKAMRLREIAEEIKQGLINTIKYGLGGGALAYAGKKGIDAAMGK